MMIEIAQRSLQLVVALHATCAAAYLALASLILAQAGRVRRLSRAGLLLACACAATTAWGVAVAVQPSMPLAGAAGAADFARALLLYLFTLCLYRQMQAGDARLARFGLFEALGIAAVVGAGAAAAFGDAGASGFVDLLRPALLARLGIAVCQLLLLENLYRNIGDSGRWHLNLACVALGGLACYDIALCADAALFHAYSPILLGGRPLAALLVAPLLALAAARNRRWDIDIHVSRSVVFHSATLVASGVFLLALAAMGEVVRRLVDAGDGYGLDSWARAKWGGVAEVALLFAGVITIAVFLTSASARSLIRGLLIEHLFSSRFDYRREWMRCTTTLSGAGAGPSLQSRAIMAVAQVVDSPAGLLLLRDPGEPGLHWAECWNMPALAAPLTGTHPLVRALHGNERPVRAEEPLLLPPLDLLASCWLAVPLRQQGELTGAVLVARPRAPFRLDHEVFDLLRVVAGEVATCLAERRAAQILAETRELRAYGERFAFVAHDIKNVSGQLSLLLSNAQRHLADPAFQRDMLATIDASVRRISGLIRRLRDTETNEAPTRRSRRVEVLQRLEAILSRFRQMHAIAVTLETKHGPCDVAMDAADFDAVVIHLLDNAVEAAGRAQPITVRYGLEQASVAIDIDDAGPGMAPEFVRDQLFRPLASSKLGGSGIGAFQARALLREAGGDLLVFSTPCVGTTMRLLIPTAAAHLSAPVLSMLDDRLPTPNPA